MSSNPHEIFTTQEDYWSWDKYIQQCDLIELSDIDRQRAKDSFRYLRAVLGEGYLKRASRQGNPMFSWYFLNSANLARLSLIRFAEALKALEGAPGYSAILRRIRRPKSLDEMAEGDSVIEVAQKFLRAGFSVEFEPRVSVTDYRGVAGPKSPDMRVVDVETGEEIIVEVSRMLPSDSQNLTSHTYEVIWNVLVRDAMLSDPEALKNVLAPRHILPRARILRGIEEEELRVVVEQIRTLVDRVRAAGEFGELIIPDTIEVGIASYDDHDRAREWAASRGMRENDQIEGADILTDEISRARVKLRDKLKQLPADKPGIVVLMPAGTNLILFVYDIRLLVASLAEEVERHPKLLCAVMFHTFQEGGKESFSVNLGPHVVTKLVRSDKVTEQSLIIHNTACKYKPSARTLEKVRVAFVTD
jgi:hypothetical protein